MFSEIITCDSSIYTMDRPDSIVCSYTDNYIDLERVNMNNVGSFWNQSPKSTLVIQLQITDRSAGIRTCKMIYSLEYGRGLATFHPIHDP